jgi:uncharacterized protein
MSDIKIHQHIEAKEPILIAGWPGMGNVALGAVDYLRRKLEATLFAEIEPIQFFIPESIIIEDGLARLPELPKNIFYFSPPSGIIIFESDAQISGQNGIHLMNIILDFARQMCVRQIFTGAAFPMPVSHRERSVIYGVANKPNLRDSLLKHRVKIMDNGQVSGLNGLLLGYAALRGIEAACLLATMPHYAISFPNPKASRAIVSILSRMLGIRIDMSEMDASSREMDKKMKTIEEKIQEMFPAVGKDEPMEQMGEKEVPQYIMEKIERLFQEANTDRRKAYELKKELDRWDLFKFYEDRFLDLFKEDQ